MDEPRQLTAAEGQATAVELAGYLERVLRRLYGEPLPFAVVVKVPSGFSYSSNIPEDQAGDILEAMGRALKSGELACEKARDD